MDNPPFEPDDLAVPPLAGPAFLELLHAQRREKYSSPPPFHEALLSGTLAREMLQLWVKNLYSYYDRGLVFSTGAIFAKTANSEKVRPFVLRKLVALEGKVVVNDLNGATTPAYEELWLRFGEGLGLTREEIAAWKPFTRSHYATSTLSVLSRWWEWSWLDGIASFYAADLLADELMGRIRDALHRHYAVEDKHLEFFANYAQDAVEDLRWEAEILAYWACTTERQLTAARAFRNRLDIEYQLVYPLHVAASSGRMLLQVP
jgi:pyrroloquinoline quinone (PQQ) biosynthesis protein C